MDLHNIRADYSKQELSEQECDASPLVQFERWLNEAVRAEVNEPTAMNVATVGEDGRPSSRMVLLKEVNAQGFVFFSNYLSRKGRALSAHPFAALTFFWPELERQVRVEGRVVLLDEAASDEYFKSRPYTSRIGAWASEQSSVIAGKSVLVARAAAVGLKHPISVPRPPHWGGYVVLPERLEFWQGRPSRLHDRIQYRLENESWLKERLAP
ncbi:MAG TPA: pyridoxamine 5'-phosphate oxidase [Neisseria sp.]|jgi:pyridoxamine 5'-phosphate oxidase|uniref:Pyridoxine/pyridoxamine 5'-phosphate oxidase n=1 Tax=Uruburuella suis TaxID=252130 RepID=A0AAE9GWX7_9NEIS|nr:pyridoxamine 5'-phosphate oxidase [Uruburuella suis]MBP7258309.1 pyridoxamine 5'-phosphate oxidase [Neisseria sp.]MBP7968925.1 pyridoxamine 5'-phosphate oxidase [Neisseria sp.]MBP8025255.1 pyridoxamine 5'-phosphate oxidase [Neisseria sp.]MBP8045246.1 pyridoxamine 5'-phosphate oxidase [Neisseria sp.]MBP8876177.1 pyridoxamine 5'-phosphate oxidase [Neisseria sp.]